MATNRLTESYKQTKYQLAGHGKRNIKVLQDAFEGVNGDTESDIYGNGSVIEAFQDKIAKYLGKEAAVFFPSGTMAQQIALRIWCDRAQTSKVAYHPLCHLEIHEENGLKMLHHIESVLLADEERVIELDDVRHMDKDVACLLLELPQREIGGQLPTFETLVEISAYCRENNIRLHLDGARLFEVLPFYRKTAAEICALFDSVYVSFYKGIGGLAGAMLAGNKDFIQESVPWKRRHGGDLISLYPYITSADYYFDKRVDKMEQYYRDAVELAAFFNGCPKVWTKPAIPVSNMFHVHVDLPKEKAEEIFAEANEETGVGFAANLRQRGESSVSFEVSLGDLYAVIPKDKLHAAFQVLAKKLS